MSDLIRRQDAIDAVFELSDKLANEMLFIDAIIDEIENLPSAESEQEEFEWCHDCKEYDQEKHCCHRWTQVIRQTIVEVKQQYALEHPEVVHCNECFYAEPADDKEDGYRCRHAMNAYRSGIWFGGDFCSYGERNDG